MLVSAVVLGLLGSLHCLGMCGPIALMLPLQGNTGHKIQGLAAYHLGRITSYTLLGITFGFVGKGLYLFGLQQNLSIAMGVIIIALVLMPASWKHRIGLVGPFTLFLGRLKRALGDLLRRPTVDALASLGFMNGFLPCGLVYMGLIGAVAMGSPWEGGLYMMLFGLGTVPLMSLVVFGRQWIGPKARFRIQRLIPIFLFFIGTLFILRGLGLGIPYVSPEPVHLTAHQESIECHHP